MRNRDKYTNQAVVEYVGKTAVIKRYIMDDKLVTIQTESGIIHVKRGIIDTIATLHCLDAAMPD